MLINKLNDSLLGHLYRYEDRLDSCGVRLQLTEFEIVKETPKGYWIWTFPRRRWVAKEGRNLYARKTKEGALRSYYARKKRQIKILRRQLDRAETALKLSPENKSAYLPYRSARLLNDIERYA